LDYILFLGKAPYPDGTFGPEVALQFQATMQIMDDKPEAQLVITGGETVKGLPSEAELIKEKFPYDMWTRIHLETRAKSTVENLTYSRRLIESLPGPLESLILVSTNAHLLEVQFVLLPRLWPEVVPNTWYVPVQGDLWGNLTHAFAAVCRIFDPHDKLLLPWFKRTAG
jgi:hypothetical protein